MKERIKKGFAVLMAMALTLSSVAGVAPISSAESIDNETCDSGDSDTAKNNMIGEERKEDELPLSEGEITSIQSSDAVFSISLNEDIKPEPIEHAEYVEEEEEESGGILDAVGGFFSGIADFIFPSTEAKAASDKMKVAYSGYVNYCGHRMGYKYISQSGDYENNLVYCMNIGKNTTEGTVTSGKNVPAKITYCLVNGARKKGGKCHTSKYSSDDAKKDYFITAAAIHVLNGEVKLSYYNDGSGVYKNIKQMVEDAKKVNKDDYNLKTGATKSIVYKISPSSTQWKYMGDGLYRSEEKFVRTKSGNIARIDYKITGAPSGLTTGEINKSSSDISDEEDLKKYDICVAQTDKDKPSANFYLYAKQDAYDQIIAGNKTIKVTANAYADESYGRQWTPTVVSQQKITFLEKVNTISTSATAKVVPTQPNKGSIVIHKTDKFTHIDVEGAQYGLYEDPECEELLCELETKIDDNNRKGLNASGLEDLTQDTYYLKELSNPEGYELDENVYEIDISYFTIKDAAGNTIQEGREFTHEETPSPVSVMIVKTDSDSKATIKNARFAVYDDVACTKRTETNPDESPGRLVPEFTYDEDLDGYVSEGFIKRQDVYYVKEVGVPAGYFDDGQVLEVRPDSGELYTIDRENTAIKCAIHGKKVDKEKTIPQGDAKLVNAVYGLYARQSIMHPDGSGYVRGTEIQADKGTDLITYDVDATAGTLLATIRTDEKGEFGFKELYWGSYYVKEITPSEGYLIDETEYDADFTRLGNTSRELEIEVTSKEQVMKQAFEIIKVSTDGKSGEIPKVKGAEFTVKLKSEITKSSWDQATVYDTLTTDEKGFARSIELPYGTYVVRETKTPDDLETVKDFEVIVDHDDRTPQEWRIFNDAPFTAYIRLIKKDEETGKEVLLPDTTFKIRKIGEEDYLTQKLGDKYITEFKTDESGTVTTPLRLMYGDYEVTEIKAPDGYLLASAPVQFKVTTTGAVRVDKDKDGDPVIDVTVENTPVKGKVIIKKTGEKLSGVRYDTIIDRIFDFITGDQRSITFEYEKQPLAGAVFNLIADEDVYTPDHQVDKDGNRTIALYKGKPVKKGEIIETVTTNEAGEASVDGLPLGKYHLEETASPKGFVPPESIEPIDLKYLDDHTAVIESESSIENIRQKTEVKVIKTEEEVYGEVASGSAVSGGAIATDPAPVESASPTASPSVTVATGSAITVDAQAASGSSVLLNPDSAGTPVEGAVYGIYSTIPITNYKGEVLIEANTLIEAEKTDANGEIIFTADLPLGKYYVKEMSPAEGYLIDPSEYEIDFTEPDPKALLIKSELKVTDIPIIIQVSKQDITTSQDIPDATLQIIDHNDEVFAEWTSDGKPYTIVAIPPGDYKLKEMAAPYGYYIATEAEFTVDETNEIKHVVMVDERAKGILEILKSDSETGEEIAGVEFEIVDQLGNVVETITTDADGIARSSELEIGEYNPDGTFNHPYTYFVNETKAADGYILSRESHKVVFEYDDNALEPIVTHLNITNQPTVPKLPQTGGDHRPWILLGAGTIGAAIGAYLYRRKRRKANGGKKL